MNTEKQKNCIYDKIQIYVGLSQNSPKLAEICYSDKPVIYTSSGNQMLVKFHSEVTYAGRGFNATYRSVPIECGGKFTMDSGLIRSTNYPLNYPRNQNCEWLLQVDSNYVVNITFKDFDIENSRNCTDDYVKVCYDFRIKLSIKIQEDCASRIFLLLKSPNKLFSLFVFHILTDL